MDLGYLWLFHLLTYFHGVSTYIWGQLSPFDLIQPHLPALSPTTTSESHLPEVWDNEDFLIYFEGHWETWEFNKETQSVRCLRPRNPMDPMDGEKMIDLAGQTWCLYYTWGAYIYISYIYYLYYIPYVFQYRQISISLYMYICAFSSSSTYTHIIYRSKAI